MSANFAALSEQLKQVEQKSDTAWTQLHRLMGESHAAFGDDTEFNRLHEEIGVKQEELEVLAKEAASILDQMDQAVEGE